MCIFQKQKTLSDEEILQKMYILQKKMAEEYNKAADVCKEDTVYETLLTILHDTHSMTKSIETELQNRGCLQLEPADKTELQLVKNRFSQIEFKY